ncbi:polyphenol oxidase family protein [Desulfovermiculus halophilus]|uniref:polyphenol oxidase family protein n=1 Tax=Desulfovermiculus halophilus TaxID=339722 RepID=UPI00047F4956|nr:polyphenol oxidase family protein [Desulfovermiculus halophilus]
MNQDLHQPTHIPFAFPGLDRVQCRFTTRFGAHRTESGDRRPQIKKMLAAPSWLDMEQVHGTDMAVISDPDRQYKAARPRADALATDLPGQALVASVADCQPLLLAHSQGRFVAALHVGWRASRAGAPGLWVQGLCENYGVLPQDIMAVRGPSLGPGKSEFVNFDAEWGPDFADYFHPQARTVDLWRMSRDQLIQAGLLVENIFSLDLCTFSLRRLFFSYRRDKTLGRQAGIIWLTP